MSRTFLLWSDKARLAPALTRAMDCDCGFVSMLLSRIAMWRDNRHRSHLVGADAETFGDVTPSDFPLDSGCWSSAVAEMKFPMSAPKNAFCSLIPSFSLCFRVIATLFIVVLACNGPVVGQTNSQDEPTQPIPKAVTDTPVEKKTVPNPPPQKQVDDSDIDLDPPITPVPKGPDKPSEKEMEGGDQIEAPAEVTPLEILGRMFFGGNDVPDQRRRQKKSLRTDPRAPFDAKLSGLLKKAQTHFRANETRQCAVVLQKLLEQPEDSLWEGAPGKLMSVRTAAQRLLAKLPQEEQDRYRLLTGGLALRELQLAQKSGNAAGLAQVATKYFQTEAGYSAADQLASKYLDRGEFGLAAHWLEELWQAQAPCTKQPGWRLKAEFVARMVPTTGLAKLLKSHAETLPAQTTIAGQLVDSRRWLAGVAQVAEDFTPTLDEWPQYFGSAKRVGQAAAGEPLLLKRWSIPQTTHPTVSKLIDKLVDDLRDANQVPILTFDPLLVDEKVIFRTLRGVAVVEASTGKLLWTTPDELSADELLAAALAQQSNPIESHTQQMADLGTFPAFAALAEVFEEMEETAPSDHPLTHLLFRNANHGLLSSDGRRLFVVEEQSVLSNLQPGKYQGEDVPDVDLFGRPLGVNRLTAYDLKSGRSVWEVGGRELSDPFTLSLAGTFIFGPPVVDGGDLFLVNELDGEIRLQVLDPVSGVPRWSQVIAHAQAKIGVDFGRQWFTSQVAVADGIIVCPTTVGWLVALDRTTRNILWAHRYQDAQDDESLEPQDDAVQSALLSERWAAAPPVIVGNRIIVTPSESQVIVCLNLSDGALQWKRNRAEEDLFLAGVFGKQAVIVANHKIMALDIENKGKTLWTVKFDAKVARPAGRGVAVQDRYYLPLTTGELLCVDLKPGVKTERVVARFKLPASKLPELGQFGNLAMYHGMLLSLSVQGMIAFEPKLSIEADLEQQLASNPHAAAAVIRKAELELLQDRPDSAWKMLRPLSSNPLIGDLRDRFRSACVRALSAVVRGDLMGHDVEFQELTQRAETSSERQTCEMLKAERFLARKQFLEAFDVYVRFAELCRSEMVVPGAVSELQVRGDHWASGQLEQLWKVLSPELASTLDQRVTELAGVASTADIVSQYQFLSVFGFHSASQNVRRRLVDALVQSESWQAAENVLWELQRDPVQRAWALERLGRLWRQVGYTADATRAYQDLERDFPASQIDGGKSALEIVKTLREADLLPESDTKPLVSWRNRNLDLNRSASIFDAVGGNHVFQLQGAGLPFFKRHRIQYTPVEARFEIVDVTTENRTWSSPLRMSVETNTESISARVLGHSVVLFGGGQVTSLSPMDRRIIWSRPQMGRPVHDEDNILSDYVSFDSSLRFAEPMRSVVDRNGRMSDLMGQWAVFPPNGAPQVIANQRYVSYLARRQLVVLDAATGEVAWERHDLPAAARIRGGSNVIYVLNFLNETVTAYRAHDGSKLEIPNLKKLCSFAVELVDDDIIRFERAVDEQVRVESHDGAQANPNANRVWLSRFDPLTQKLVWRNSLPNSIRATSISGQRLVILNTDGRLQLCDLKTGKLTDCGNLLAKSIRKDTEIRVIPTYDQILVVANQNPGFSDDDSPEFSPSIRVRGMIHAFDLATGHEQWKQSVEGLSLILDRLDHSPVVLLMSRKYQQHRINNLKLSLLAIDRFGGKIVHESTSAIKSTFQLLNINVPDGFVELRTYNDRMRLSPKPD